MKRLLVDFDSLSNTFQLSYYGWKLRRWHMAFAFDDPFLKKPLENKAAELGLQLLKGRLACAPERYSYAVIGTINRTDPIDQAGTLLEFLDPDQTWSYTEIRLKTLFGHSKVYLLRP